MVVSSCYLSRLDLSGPVLRLRLPVAPSQNVWRDLHWAEKRRLRAEALTIARVQVGQLSAPWASRALLAVVRCSEATVRADTANVWGGTKELVDVLLSSRPKRPGVGLLIDDDPAHLVLGGVEDRPRGHWGDLPGPATWIYVVRLDDESLTCPGDHMVSLVSGYVEAASRASSALGRMIAAVNAALEGS